MPHRKSRPRDPEKVAYWSKRIAEWKSSGLSVITFCRKKKLNRYRFYYWRKTLRSTTAIKKRTSPEPTFASLQVNPPVLFEPVDLKRNEIEIRLLHKYTIRVRTDIDPKSLKMILHLLEHVSC